MAYVETSYDATYESVDVTADRPMLGSNAIKTTPTASRWTASALGVEDIADASLVDTAYPTSNAWDGKTHLDTQPSTAGTTRTLIYDFGATGLTFDFAAIIGHNFFTLSATATLAISDLPDFDTGAGASRRIALAAWTPANNNRIIDLQLGTNNNGNNRYSGVRYVALQVTGSSGKPAVGELILGRRRQLFGLPMQPFDTSSSFATTEDFVARSGARTRYLYNKGGRRLEGVLQGHTSTYTGNVGSWFADTDYGHRPFIWIPNPGTAPSTFMMMYLDESSMMHPYVDGPNERRFNMRATEQGPDYKNLET